MPSWYLQAATSKPCRLGQGKDQNSSRLCKRQNWKSGHHRAGERNGRRKKTRSFWEGGGTRGGKTKLLLGFGLEARWNSQWKEGRARGGRGGTYLGDRRRTGARAGRRRWDGTTSTNFSDEMEREGAHACREELHVTVEQREEGAAGQRRAICSDGKASSNGSP